MQDIEDLQKQSLSIAVNSSENYDFLSFQCHICMKQFNRQNHPIKICHKDHNMCQQCVKFDLFKPKPKQNNQPFKICPFCGQETDTDQFVVNYKTVALQKISKQNNESVSLFQQIGPYAFRILFSFLNQPSKLALCSTNILLRSFLLDNQCWGQFLITDYYEKKNEISGIQQNWVQRVKWYKKYFNVVKPQQIMVKVYKFADDQNLHKLFIKQNLFVSKVGFCFQNQSLHLLIAKSCINLSDIYIGSYIFSDELFLKMAKSLSNIKRFQLCKDDGNFSAVNLSKYFPKGLESLLIKQHNLIFEQIVNVSNLNRQSLNELELDIELCSQQVLDQIIQPLKNLQYLKLSHLQNISNESKLIDCITQTIRHIYLTKPYQLYMNPLINKVCTAKLLTLDLVQAVELNDDDLMKVAKNSPYLQRITISWCNRIGTQALKQLLSICVFLEYISLNGVKSCKDQIFSQYLPLKKYFKEKYYDQVRRQIKSYKSKFKFIETINYDVYNFFQMQTQQPANKVKYIISNIKMIKRLKFLQCISCNMVSDQILKIIGLLNRKAQLYNYYAVDVALYAQLDINDYQQNF